ncbi:unnamed protein product [Meloidogyne enterolobii]|uniref:Uncharacterized protein n=1 Tax=Meloidogyne enterolobii TaxID=390850 RepID=A0ACB0YGB3_MELEN
MTGAELTADTPIYENFVATVPYLNTLFHLKKYLKNLRDSRQILLSALPDLNPPTQYRSERYLELPPNNKKSKILLKANRPQHSASTDTNMECDPTPTIGIATTDTHHHQQKLRRLTHVFNLLHHLLLLLKPSMVKRLPWTSPSLKAHLF